MFNHLLRKWLPGTNRAGVASSRPFRRRPQSKLPPAGQWKLLRLESRDVPATIGFAIGGGPGAEPQVKVYDNTGNVIMFDSAHNLDGFDAFPGFGGGVHVATGDVNGDGIPDLVVGAGPGGGPHVKVYDGAAIESGEAGYQTTVANPLKSFYAYASTFRGGVNVAVGDINGDGHKDIVTGAGPGGGPHVKVFNFSDLTELYSFFAYFTAFKGGVSVAASDVGGDTGNPPIHSAPSDDLVTGAGPNGGPHVKVYAVSLTDDTQLDLVGQYYAYNQNFQGGITVSSDRYTNNVDTAGHTYGDIATAPMTTGVGVTGPEVKIWRLDNGQNVGTDSLFSFVTAADFNAYFSTFAGGVALGTTAADFNGDGLPDLLTGAGPTGGPHQIVWGSLNFVTAFGTPANPNGDLGFYTPPKLQQQYVYDPKYPGGISVSE
jgi:hypothetical protein